MHSYTPRLVMLPNTLHRCMFRYFVSLDSLSLADCRANKKNVSHTLFLQSARIVDGPIKVNSAPSIVPCVPQ